MHVFQSLSTLDGADALRTDGDEPSQVGYWAIGGQLAHAAGMCAVVCPSVNSYKRLNAGHRAPRHATWARVSQTSLIRVPLLSAGERTEIELRSPDALSNPYLVFATALACALDGIQNQIEPPEPLNENLTTYNDEEFARRGVLRLPGTLGEALSAYLEDRVVRETIGSYISSQLVKVKRDEWEAYRAHVSPWEFDRYVDA
jgi:glutamine synthetase